MADGKHTRLVSRLRCQREIKHKKPGWEICRWVGGISAAAHPTGSHETRPLRIFIVERTSLPPAAVPAPGSVLVGLVSGDCGAGRDTYTVHRPTTIHNFASMDEVHDEL